MGIECYKNHKSNKLCETVKKCLICLEKYKRKFEHKCFHSMCNICQEVLPDNNKCMLKKITPKEKVPLDKMIFYDFETYLNENLNHVEIYVLHHMSIKNITKYLKPQRNSGLFVTKDT